MQYRYTLATDDGFENPQQEYDAMREYAQTVLARTDPDDIMDTIVVMANVCEARSLETNVVPEMAGWYKKTANIMRAVLLILGESAARPNVKLENPLLYFPDVKNFS